MAKKVKDVKLGFQKDKRKSAVEKSKKDVVPVERGIYRPLPKTKGTPVSKKQAPKKTKSAKLRKAKSVKSNFRKKLNKAQRQRRRQGHKRSDTRCRKY